jgi:hypothetical protein
MTLERRLFYFGVVHNKGDDGRVFANVKFHARSYAIQQNPALAGVTFPMAAPPITLRPAPTAEAPEAVSHPPTQTVEPPRPSPVPTEDDGGITPEELAEAVAYARSLRAKKQEPSAKG